MSRRTRHKDPPKAQSVSWTEYGPGQASYWMYAGPRIAPEDIPASPVDPDSMGGGMKGEGRKTYLREIIRSSQSDLERQTAKYLALHEKGMEAVEAWIVESWRQRVSTLSVKPGDPDPVSEQLASCYRSIRWSKGRLIACEKAFDNIERTNHSLFHWND